MPPTLTFTGVTPEVRVVSLITLVQKHTGLRLKEAKETVEKVLEGQQVEFTVSTEAQAHLFAQEARDLGALVAHEAGG